MSPSPTLKPPELISVFLAPEHPQTPSGDVAQSDRQQVLDGIVDYDGS